MATVTAGGHGAGWPGPVRPGRPNPRDRNGLTPGSGPRGQWEGSGAERLEAAEGLRNLQHKVRDSSPLTMRTSRSNKEPPSERPLRSRQRGGVIEHKLRRGLKEYKPELSVTRTRHGPAPRRDLPNGCEMVTARGRRLTASSALCRHLHQSLSRGADGPMMTCARAELERCGKRALRS